MELATPEQVSITSREDFFFSLFPMLAQPYSPAHFRHLYEIAPFILQVNKASRKVSCNCVCIFHLGRWGLCGGAITSLIVHILKAFELSDALKSSPGSHSQSLSNSVAITCS